MKRLFNKYRHSEEAFLLASVSEFVKCWSSGKKSRLIIESVSGKAFIHFSAFLGYPKDDHFKARAEDRQPKPKPKAKQKSERKIQRDNARAAKFQERKKREMALTTSPVSSSLQPSGQPTVPTTLSPFQVEASSTSFHFSEPLPENLRESSSSETMRHTSSYFSSMEEEKEPNEMEPSSIFDQFPVTLGDSEEIEEVTVEEESQVSRATDQTAAVEEEEGAAAAEQATAAAEQATAAEGRRDDSRTKVSTQISTPENQTEAGAIRILQIIRQDLRQTQDIIRCQTEDHKLPFSQFNPI